MGHPTTSVPPEGRRMEDFMNFFDVDWLQKGADLMKEAFTFKKYKAMSPVLAVLSGIVMIPVVLLSFLLAAVYFLLSFFFSIEITPIKFLHGLITKEGKDVMHATQFAVYWIAWPVVFFFYVLASALLVFLAMFYALLSILTFVWSFGGFKFHLFPVEADISIDVKEEYPVILPALLVLGGVVILLILPLTFTLIDCIKIEFFDFFLTIWKLKTVDMIRYDFIFGFLYSLILMCPRPAAAVGSEEKTDSDAE
jgi:hypothetical protein